MSQMGSVFRNMVLRLKGFVLTAVTPPDPLADGSGTDSKAASFAEEDTRK